MPDYDIDLTLDSLMIPAISETFPFGTKVIPTVENKGGLSTAEVNSNVMLPFTRMRPRVCSADSVTSRVEYDAKIVFSAPQGTTPASGYTLTLGTGDYVGCTVTLTNLLAHACTVRQSDGTTTLFSVPAGKTMSAMWTGTAWRWTTSGTVSANDPTPVSSAAVQSAIAIKTLFVKGQIIEGTNTTIKGQGTAEVILANGKAIVYFTAKISTAGSETNVFSWGLSRTALKTLNSSVPTITPTTGGSGKFYSSAGTVDSSSTGFGACFQSSTSYWTPARLYDTSGNIGAWPPSMVPVDLMITGTVCGSY